MSTKDKVLKELKSILIVWLYFLSWFGILMLIKVLLLDEYKIEFYGVSVVVIGALIAAKSVLLLELVPLGFNKTPAITAILSRTFLYLFGVTIILILEHGIETRHEYGGFLNALNNLSQSTNSYHILVNVICVFGALFFYNLGSVIKGHLGKEEFKKILISPIEKQ